MSKDLRILIVDDEPEARTLLNVMLQEEKDIEVVGLAGSVDEAMSVMDLKGPDLVLLDIQMPGKDGFKFIQLLNESDHRPEIIFVTAYENYAIRAIRSSVFDYILKPVRQSELTEALQRFRDQRHARERSDLGRLLEMLRTSVPGRVKFNTRAGYILIDPPDLVYCKAEGNYTHLQLVNGHTELTTQNLGAVEEILDRDSFFRASRSYLINLRYLARVDRKSCSCIMDYAGRSCTIKIPTQRIKLLESAFG